jgi:hypothetical protein
MTTMREKNPYSPGITGRQRHHFIEGEWVEDEPRSPVLDYPEHNNRHAPKAPRVERFVVWCIDHQVGMSVALWALIMAACVLIWSLWW